MYRKGLLLIVAVLLCPAAGFVRDAEARRPVALAIGKGEATVSFLQGSADVLETDRWTPLKTADTLGEGDRARTGTGARLELQLPDESHVRFAGNSDFRMVRLAQGEKTRDAKVHVALGKAWVRVAATAGMKGPFELSCDHAVAGVRGTVYRMNVEEDRSALVRVYEGVVHVSGGGRAPEAPRPIGPPTRVEGPKPVPGPRRVTMEEWTVIVRAMQQVSIGADGTPGKPIGFSEAEDRDEWVDWNRERDRGGEGSSPTVR